MSVGEPLLDQEIPVPNLEQAIEILAQVQYALMQGRRTVEWLGSDQELDKLRDGLVGCILTVGKTRDALIQRYYAPLQPNTDVDMVKPESARVPMV